MQKEKSKEGAWVVQARGNDLEYIFLSFTPCLRRLYLSVHGVLND